LSKPVIEVTGLAKRYRLGAIGATSLREEVSRYWDRLRGVPHPDTQEFWALRDVSFTVQPGEVVGVIGRNGAGKSTLLKILSRITEPTSGRAVMRGRVASLLEVGTGFHPELTGRENIFLNGAILGMRRDEVRRKFDEIVAFAEVDQFIDTPVKRYSSGMYVRLAFAVAAHLEPEILIIDEVLAVGDAQFQKKCLGKMQEVSSQHGRTVLFVSHTMGAVARLCRTCIWLENGRVKRIDDAKSVVSAYLSADDIECSEATFGDTNGEPAQYSRIRVLNTRGEASSTIADNEPFVIEAIFEVRATLPDIYFGVILQNAEGIPVIFADSRDVDNGFPARFSVGTHCIRLTVPPVLAPGLLVVSAGIATTSMQILDHREAACRLQIVDSRGIRTANRPGLLNLSLPWVNRPLP